MFQCCRKGRHSVSLSNNYIYNNNITYPMFWNVCHNDTITYNHTKPTIFPRKCCKPMPSALPSCVVMGRQTSMVWKLGVSQQQLPPGVTTFFVGNPELTFICHDFYPVLLGVDPRYLSKKRFVFFSNVFLDFLVPGNS